MSKKKAGRKSGDVFTKEELAALHEYAAEARQVTVQEAVHIQPLLQAFNNGIETGDFKEVFKLLRLYKDSPLAISTLANQLVIFKSLTDMVTHITKTEFLTNHDISKNPPLVES